jgi:hypothetical protein
MSDLREKISKLSSRLSAWILGVGAASKMRHPHTTILQSLMNQLSERARKNVGCVAIVGQS